VSSDQPNTPDASAEAAAAPAGEPAVETSTTDAGQAATPPETDEAPVAEPASPAAEGDVKDDTTPEDGKGEPAAAPPPHKARPRFRDPSIARAFRSRRPVNGKILGVIKGGYEVRVGRSRAFCPHSQIDLFRVDNPEERVGQTFAFRVTQFRRGGEDIVLSRRVLLEEERAEEASALRAALLEGSVVQGKVAGTADFGAFVDLGAGVMGLVHISELSHTRITRVTDAVKPGDAVQAKILKLHEGGKISLSVRQATEDPWAAIGDTIKTGDVLSGKVQRLTDFGAFVELKPGVEALAPAREFPPKSGGWREGLEPGTEVSWLVLGVDAGRRRISLTPAPDDPTALDLKLEDGATLEGKVQKVERFGVFVWLAPGRVGLMPNVWSGEPKGADMERKFPIGSSVEVEVVEVVEDGKRIRLAKKGAYKPEAEPRRAPSRRPEPAAPAAPAAPATPFGNNLGDVLRAALDRTNG
jgi:small subunit ribosomal protein S1